MSNENIKTQYSLLKHNTFAVSALAAYFTTLNVVEDVKALLKSDSFTTVSKKFILGQGSNTLFVNDFDGLVIQNCIKGINAEPSNNNKIIIEIGAGESWHEVVLYAINNQLYGIENLSLIPGTVGAAPIQNIGAYGAEVKDVFHSLDAINLATGEQKTFDKDDCQFGYRDSIFKNILKNQYLITTVRLTLSTTPRFNIDYCTLREKLGYQNINTLTLKAVSDAVIAIRQSKLPDPTIIPNAGSFFKNPIIIKEKHAHLISTYESMPSYPLSDDQIKIPAGWLIEQCGWKGKRIGKVGVHEHQALVLVNHGGASGKELYDLSQEIQRDVSEQFEIKLVPEVGIIG